MPLLKSLLRSLLITVVFVPFAALLPLAAVALCRYDWGVQIVFWGGPWSAAVWSLFLSQVISSRCWRGAEAVRRWRASRGGYLHTVPVACLWTFGSLFGSYACEFVVLFLTRKVYLLPVGTYTPVALAVLWCASHG